MKLRNKKTGAIGNYSIILQRSEGDAKAPVRYGCGTLAKLNADWEDYKPAEPLIKDEKIRRAVRAWAEVNLIKKALYAERADRSFCLLTDMGIDDYNIEFVGRIPTLNDGDDYTIAELCGEEE